MNFIENKDLGFKKEGVLYAYSSPEKLNAFQEGLKQIPEIYHVGNGSNLGIETFNQSTYKLQGSDAIFDDANQLYMDYEALKAYGISSTLNDNVQNRRTTIINRTAAEKFAKIRNTTPEKVIGNIVITEPEYISEEGQVGVPFIIGGIFEDINIFSLKESVTPYFITLSPNVRMGGTSIVSFDATKTALVVNNIKKVYEELNDNLPLEINFLNDNLDSLYKQEKQAVDLIFYMNVLAILLSAIGIIGVTVFLVLAKRKEIGIRMVLGASDMHIMKATVREYVLYCSVALIIGWPIAYYGSVKWLDSFAYKVEISHYIFLIVAFLVFVGTALLVGTIALNAAHKNRVKSLRTE
jgi:putative ABC transport system permease protein